jgi:hypothetical protein
MGRPPINDRAMSGAERQRRYRARKPSPPLPVDPAPVTVADAAGGLMVNVEHLRRWPDRVVPWLVQQLGHRAARALRDALDQAIKTAQESEVDTP